MSTLADLVTLGYTVDEDVPNGVAAVRGHGVATMVGITDQAAIDSLAVAATAPPPPAAVPYVDEAAANLAAAVTAVVSAPDFPTAQANLKALVKK